MNGISEKLLSYLKLYALTLAVLLVVTFAEKTLFALYYREAWGEQGLWEGITALLWGIKFDLAAAALFAFLAYALALLLTPLLRPPINRVLTVTVSIAAITLMLLHGADLLYYGEAGRHLGYELKESFNSAAGLASSAIFTYPAELAVQVALMILVYRLIKRLFQNRKPPQPAPARWMRIAEPSITIFATLIITVLLVRGGVGSVPMEPLHAQEIGKPALATIALNGSYNAIFSSVTPYSVQPVFASAPDTQTKRLVRDLYPPRQAVARPQWRPNIVLVLLESWSGVYMGGYGYPDTTTPNFDRIGAKGLTTTGMFAGGLRTTEGMFSTLCSWPNPLGQTVAQSQLQNYDYLCLPHILREEGYQSAFFQGTLANTSGTGAFAQLLGFEKSYGKSAMPRGRYPRNGWGAHDPDLYDFTLSKMEQMKQPFLIGINTNSTHDLELPKGVAPLVEGEDKASRYVNVLHFADQALGEFIDKVEQSKKLDDTLFILVADHTGYSPANARARYLIPFALYAPGKVAARHIDTIASQRDIAPTLLELLGLPTPAHFTGTSLLQDDTPHFSDYYLAGLFGWAEGEELVEFTLNRQSEPTCYLLQGSPANPHEQECTDSDSMRLTRATAFAHLTQSLLFEGKTGEFARIRDPDRVIHP